MSVYYITPDTCHFLSKEYKKIKRKERIFMKIGESRIFLPINVYLLGSKENIIKEAILLHKRKDGSCGLMASVNTGILTKAYIKLAESKLIVCGLARVGPYVGSGGHWSAFAGNALWSINNAILLSVNTTDVDCWGILSGNNGDIEKHILRIKK